MMRDRVVQVRVLDGPKAVLVFAEQRLPALESRLEALRLVRIGHVDLGAVSLHQLDVLKVGSMVDDADEPEVVVSANLREADAHVSRARFDNDGFACDSSCLYRAADDAEGRSVFHAAAGIVTLEFRVEVER